MLSTINDLLNAIFYDLNRSFIPDHKHNVGKNTHSAEWNKFCAS
jgi:hypothetical protein